MHRRLEIRNPNIEVRNKFESAESKFFKNIRISILFRISEYVLRIFSLGQVA